MKQQRRQFIKVLAVGGGACAAAALGILVPSLPVHAADKTDYDIADLQQLLPKVGADKAKKSADILITSPELAANGSMVPITVRSNIPGTERITLIAEGNPFPLIAEFDFLAGAEAYASIRIKMLKSSDLRAIVTANGQLYTASSMVKVTIGGCGG